MLIDWFTVIAQVINFLVLVWLLKHFLFQPILNAIDAREKKTAATVAEAKEIKEQAEQSRDHFRDLNTNLESNYKKFLSDARNKAHQEYESLMEKARQDVKNLVQKQMESLKQDEEQLKQFVQQRSKDELFFVLKKTLHDLADVSLEAQMVSMFLDRFKKLNDDEKKRLAIIKKSLPKEILIQTAFDLSLPKQKNIRETIQSALDTNAPIYFETCAHIVSGIKLLANGQEISWSVDRYLESLGRKVDELLSAAQFKHHE